MTRPLGIAVIGCGLIGRRRAAEAAAHPETRLVVVADANADAARETAAPYAAAVAPDWRGAIQRADVDVVCVATPNGFLADIGVAALEHGKHVLVEKPMGRTLAEAMRMRDAATRAGRRLKVGFNHRFHPAILEAKQLADAGEVGEIISLRCRYGHGGRAGYEREWRGSRELAGGGELTDQGVHVMDLVHWFAGPPSEAFAVLQTAVWPLNGLEDNAYGLFRFGSGAVAWFHTSWTQWKNLFSFEVFGQRGALVVDGLGRSYGTETLTVHRRRPEGGVPETVVKTFPGEDLSWRAEWADFVQGIRTGGSILGDEHAGIIAMAMLDACYRAAAAGHPVGVVSAGERSAA